MRVDIAVKKRTEPFQRDLKSANEQATTAMAYVYYNAVKRGLRGGFTSGDFTTGTLWNTVTITDYEPEADAGVYAVRVGTNLRYALYWELGHHNIFTRQFEWVPVWQPTLEEKRREMYETYKKALVRLLFYQGGRS